MPFKSTQTASDTLAKAHVSDTWERWGLSCVFLVLFAGFARVCLLLFPGLSVCFGYSCVCLLFPSVFFRGLLCSVFGPLLLVMCVQLIVRVCVCV